jgi:hypothetical protein
MENPILTVAFVVAITAFFKEHLGLTGWKVMLAAFLTAMVLAFLPLLASTFPQAAPWLNQFVQVVILFLTAAGTVDFVKQLRQ